MPSGGEWQISLGDMMLAFSLFVLFFEILKSTRTGGNSVVDHALSMIVFVVCLILFLIWPPGRNLAVLFDHAHDPDRRHRRVLGHHQVGTPRLLRGQRHLELRIRLAKKAPGTRPGAVCVRERS